MNDFESMLYASAKNALLTIEPAIKSDIYALSFFFDAHDDPRLPILTIGYNTLSHWNAATPSASSADEAKWNYAFWPQNELSLVGIPDSDSAAIWQSWLEANALWVTDEDEEDDPDRFDEACDTLIDIFIQFIVRAASRLHKEGVVAEVFGRDIPIIVHELEYYDEIAELTRMANPAGLSAEFEGWVRGN